MNQSIFKKLLTTILILGTVSTFGIDMTTHAEESVQEIPNNKIVEGSTKTNNKSYQKDVLLRESVYLAYNLTVNHYIYDKISREELLPIPSGLNPLFFESDPSIQLNNDMVFQNGENVAANYSELHNETSIDQDMFTVAFKYEQTDSITTKTSNTAGGEFSYENDMNLPGFGGSKITLKAKYEFGHTKETKEETNRTWTLPADKVRVPAGRKYLVLWILETGEATGTVNLISKVSGFVPYMLDPATGSRVLYDYVEAIKVERMLEEIDINNPYKWRANSDWTVSDGFAARVWSPSRYTAKYGTRMIKEIRDITDDKNTARSDLKNIGTLVSRTPLDITPVNE